ncbi:Sin3 histone deacetylase corepressor complex component SDS3 [Frankliniella fusca]|uniref:Sin3 histone deacetylase corepressor complex component SDS3 n=1 Tax=Frankliniella fusca TaxID=407009 RepID=A0AAE1GXV9_9NEOP|nr:Sin3 histone deacetylase corepressor complex component SDS3 [Frankliniella fusca]
MTTTVEESRVQLNVPVNNNRTVNKPNFLKTSAFGDYVLFAKNAAINSKMSSFSTHDNVYTSSSVFLRDEYDFDDDNDDLEEDRENDDQDESDEDTEEASESEMGKPEEYRTEIKEQMYRDKLASFKKQLQQLKDGSHPEYNRKLKKLEANYRERLRLNVISRDYAIECIDKDYVVEKRGAANEFEEKKHELRENLISDLEERRKQVEAERHTMELTGDPMEVIKPAMTRKLRRRPNDPVPVPENKRRKPPPAQVNYTLEDKEIESDLKAITRGKMPQNSNIRKPNIFPSPSVNRPPSPLTDSSNQDTRIEDGKLVYERRWFHRGQPVYAEGKDMPRFAGNISGIGNDVIYVKKLDNTKVRIPLVYLVRGKVSIKRRAS